MNRAVVGSRLRKWVAGRATRIVDFIGEIESRAIAAGERWALAVPVVVALGIALWFGHGNAAWPVPLGIVCLAALLNWKATETFCARLLLVGALCFATGYGLIALKTHVLAEPGLDRPWTGSLSGLVDEVEPVPSRGIVRLTMRTSASEDLPRSVRVNVREDRLSFRPRPGDVVTMRVRLMPPAGPAVPGAYDFSQRAWFEGIGASGTAIGPVRLLEASKSGVELADLRARLAAHVRERLPGPAGGLASTLATGDRGAISDADAQAMRDSGLAHLLSISGLHVSAVVAAAFLLVERLIALIGPLALRIPARYFAAGAGALAAVGYTLLTGSEVPTVRSCAAAILVLVALVLGRDPFSLRLVAAGALFVMFLWPETVVGPSFQMSFAAVTAIIALHEHPRIRALLPMRDASWRRRLLSFVGLLFLTGLAVEAALSPVALYHFHKAGLYGALANLIAIPLTTFVIMPMEALALAADMAGMGAPFWFVCGAAIDLLLALAHFVSSQPGAVVKTAAYPGWLFAILLTAIFLTAIFPGKARKYLLGIAAIGLVVGFSWPRPDLLITGDGRQVAIVDGKRLTLLREGRSDYLKDLLSENVGISEPVGQVDERPHSRCSEDSCVARLWSGGRQWTILATRSSYLIPAMELAAACRRVDIVISNRRLPQTCRPRWLKADRQMLGRTGGLSIRLTSGTVKTVAEETAHLPWARLRN